MMPSRKGCRARAAGWTPLRALLVAWLCCSGAATGQDLADGTVLDVTRGAVIVDRGEADGLQPLAELRVFRGGREIGRLAVDYLARHSAACTIIAAVAPLAQGDEVRFVPALPQPPEPQALESPAREPEAPESSALEPEALASPALEPLLPESIPARPRPRAHAAIPRGGEPSRLRGRAAFEWTYFADAKDTRRDFEQSAIVMRIEGRRLWQRPLHFHLRLRTRYDHRRQPLGSIRPETEWLHRVHQLSLTYHDPRCPVILAFGRLFAPIVPSIGNWDGALLEWRVNHVWQLFALGGGAPGLTEGEPDFDRQKLAAGLALAVGETGRGRFEGALAFAGEYASGDASREFIALGNTLSIGRALSVRQSLELDANRGWRRNATGESWTLSRLNADILFRPGRRLQVNLGYAGYQSVPRIESRDVPDSLRVDAKLAGMRLGARLKLSQSVRVGGSIGYRDRRGEDERPVFGNVDLSFSDVLRSSIDLVVQHAHADGRFADSRVPSLDLQRRFGPALVVGLGLGAQSYEGYQAESFSLQGRWFTFRGTYRLSRPLDLSWLWRRNTGDIGAGDRFLLQIGCRW